MRDEIARLTQLAWLNPETTVPNKYRIVGIFDSGIGGLSVFSEIRRTLPDAKLIYVADTAHAPYGDRSPSYIEDRSLRICDFLVGLGAQAIVIACNTASSHAAAAIRSRVHIPIIAMEPAIKPAALTSQSKVVAVLATSQSIASANVASLVKSYGQRNTQGGVRRLIGARRLAA